MPYTDPKPTISDIWDSGHAFASGLVAFWPFYEGSGSTGADVVNGNDATLSGVTWVTGANGSDLCPDFDGGTDQGLVSPDAAIDTLGAMSIVIWYNQPSDGAGALMDKRTTGVNPPGFRLALLGGGSNQIQFARQLSTGAVRRRISPASGNSYGGWRMFVLTYDGSVNATGVKGYFDAVEGSYASPVSGTSTPSADDSANDLLFGDSNVSGDTPLTGQIDHIRIYDDVLTPTEIADLYATPWLDFGIGGGSGVPFDWMDNDFIQPARRKPQPSMNLMDMSFIPPAKKRSEGVIALIDLVNENLR